MDKAIWVVKVDGYRPDICEKTLPTVERYAKRIGASFNLIEKRRWPQASPPYEKLQAYYLGEGKEWNVVIDADMLVEDGMYDVTQILPPNRVACWMAYEADKNFPSDDYFFRDGRNLGVSSNFLVVPRACHDVLTPFPDDELPSFQGRIKRPFIVDEYCISRNMARFGIKHSGILLPSFMANPPFRHFYVNSGEDSSVEIGKAVAY
jgi:hypothetical protein